MSTTVTELIEEIQDMIPEDRMPNLMPALNRAIQTIAKQLYILESDLLLGELSIGIYAEQTYEATTIAFASGGNETADTITDSVSGFVTEGFVAGMPLITDCSGNIGPHRIYSVAAETINLDARESVLTTVAAGSSYTLTSVDEYGYMPDDFWGLTQNEPYIDGYTWTLLPLPNQQVALGYMSPGVPRYYRVKDNRLYVYPATSSDITVKGDYWKKPVRLTTMNDYVPWNEQFDDTIVEYLARILVAGVPITDDSLGKYLGGAAAIIAAKRGRRAPAAMPGGIYYGF